jgi:hypothetical protein
MTLDEAITAMVNALQPLLSEIPELQIYGYFNTNPTPPSIDIYPADPFQDGAGFGAGEKRVFWNVRARVASGDPEAASKLLLRLLDPNDPASVETALLAAGATVGNDGSVGGFVRFADDAIGDLLATQWRVEMYV